MRKNKKHFTPLLLGACATLLLGACKTSSSTPKSIQDSKIDAALERAAIAGAGTQSLAYLEKIYKRNSNDALAATNYAEALRKHDHLNQAALILAPFANKEDSPSTAKSEYAAILLSQGNHKSAEQYAQKAIIKDENNYKAYHYLAIALDAQEEHEKAERAMRKGLDIWQGDPTPIMNNLALNLASQGFLNEAHDILLKAKALAPDRLEVERNLRIVMALKQSNFVDTRKPIRKPTLPATKTKPVKKEDIKEGSQKATK